MSVQQAYDLWSASYDADHNPTRDLDRAVMTQVLGEQRFGIILEVGCGTGKNTGLLAEIGETLTAVDFSSGMLAKAKAKITAHNVTFQQADITKPWSTPAASFDLVTFNLILEHIEDLDFVMGQASQALATNGLLFICELHPFKQYRGSQAQFTQDGEVNFVPAFTHHTSDFLAAAQKHGLKLQSLNEWWHEDDGDKPPRLISFLFRK
ncbi:class I SAM-dependent methyltransferase [Candidatus Leptofilum sp.]|uniref:class I SAM-dependent methyltransferase n=1 Tax=Candidatus Leptofilum sp. TaxID=3241576 RepID=UPI003B58B8C3